MFERTAPVVRTRAGAIAIDGSGDSRLPQWR
jgi:hypothetical protein